MSGRVVRPPYGSLASFVKWHLSSNHNVEELRGKIRQISLSVALSQRHLKLVQLYLTSILSIEVKARRVYFWNLRRYVRLVVRRR